MGQKVSAPLQTNKPSTQEALKAFNDIFKIDKNLKTGFINISIDHYFSLCCETISLMQ